MVEQKVVIINKLGLHLRAAALLVQTASTFESEVHIRKHDIEVDAKSIMGVLGLEASKGVELLVTADGSDEEAALKAITGLVEMKFDEEE
jgi:phosphocarrier protein HPr